MTRAHPEWTVLNRGINGQRTDEILDRLDRDGLKERPDYLIILAGVNDLYQGREFALVCADLSSIYIESGRTGTRVVAATILPFNTMTREQETGILAMNRWIRESAAARGLLLCDTHSLVLDPRNPHRLDRSPDGLHPGVAGYRKMGEGLVRAIELAEAARTP